MSTAKKRTLSEDPGNPTEVVEEIQRLQAKISNLEGKLKVPNEDPSFTAPATIAENLPAEMYFQIFKYMNIRSLKDCRLVCKTWKNTIIGNSKLMKELTFDIFDARSFLESELITKVKSIRFQIPLQNSEECLEEFFTKIGPSIEQVDFSFRKQLHLLDRGTELDKQNLMIQLLFRHSMKLNSLIIATEDREFLNYLNMVQFNEPQQLEHLYHGLPCLAVSTIQHLLVNVGNISAVEMNYVKVLVLCLRNLKRLDIISPNGPSIAFCVQDIIMDCLEKYKRPLEVISFDKMHPSFNQEVILQICLNVAKLYPNTHVNCLANLNYLSVLQRQQQQQRQEAHHQGGGQEDEDQEQQQQMIRPIQRQQYNTNNDNYNMIVNGILQFRETEYYRNVVDPQVIGLCTNLRCLYLEVHSQVKTEDVNFMSNLKKLLYLKVTDYSSSSGSSTFPPFSTTYPPPPPTPVQQQQQQQDLLDSPAVFACGIPSLIRLDLSGSRLKTNLLSFHTNFPNLTKLLLRKSGEIPQDFIYSLTKLDKLKCLTLEFIVSLTDNHLTSTFDSNKPAIASFNCLNHLHIACCDKLTDKCLIDGIAICDNNLKKITLCYRTEQFSINVINEVKEMKGYELQDLVKVHHGRNKHSLPEPGHHGRPTLANAAEDVENYYPTRLNSLMERFVSWEFKRLVRM